MAAMASPRVIAGPSVMSAVPARIRAWTRRPLAGLRRAGGIAPATPTSMTVSDAPELAARTLIAAPPPMKLASIWAVTSEG